MRRSSSRGYFRRRGALRSRSSPVETNSPAVLAVSRTEYLRRMFDIHDTRSCGALDVRQTCNLLKCLNEPAWLIENISNQMKSGVAPPKISFDHFVKIVSHRQRDFLREVEAAFQIFDTNGDGFLDCAELRHVLCNLGERMSEDEVDDIFRELDLNHDDRIGLEEFLSFVSRHSS